MRRRVMRRLCALLACVPLLLAGCGVGGTTAPPTLATAAIKPFERVTIVDWLNTTEDVRLAYLTDALAAYPNCPLTARDFAAGTRNVYTAKAPSNDTPRALFLRAVADTGCRPSGVNGPRMPTP